MSEYRTPDRGAVLTGLSPATIRKIIAAGDPTTLVSEAESFGAALRTGGLTKSQIRGVFGTVRQIDAQWDKRDQTANLRKVLMLKVRLAYQAAREPAVKPLAQTLSGAIDVVAESSSPEERRLRFGYFVDFFEAILAYHTAAGGR